MPPNIAFQMTIKKERTYPCKYLPTLVEKLPSDIEKLQPDKTLNLNFYYVVSTMSLKSLCYRFKDVQNVTFFVATPKW